MALKIVYFSRTGTCRGIAESIARELNREVLEITSTIKWKYIWGFLKAGYYTLKNKFIEISLNGEVEKEDTIIAIAPVWAGMIAQPMKQFLNSRSNGTHLVLVSSGSGSDLTLDDHILSKRDIILNSNNREDVLKEVIDSINKGDRDGNS